MSASFKFKPRSYDVYEDNGVKVIAAAVDISIDDISCHATVYAKIPYTENLTIPMIEEQLIAIAKSKLKAIVEFI